MGILKVSFADTRFENRPPAVTSSARWCPEPGVRTLSVCPSYRR
jgi:hypothetical protein